MARFYRSYNFAHIRSAAKQSRVLASRSARAAAVARARKASYVPRRLYLPRGNVTLQQPFPTTKSGVVMRFVTTKDISIASNAVDGTITNSSFYFRANGINDPDPLMGGHQPLGHDQWQAIYNHYEVTGAKAMAYFQPKYDVPTANGMALTYGLGIIDGGVGRSKDEDCMMDGNYKWKKAGYYLMPTIGLGTSYNPYKWNNISSRALPDSLTAAFGADPTEQQYFHVWAALRSSTLPAANLTVNVTVVIEYTCKFSEPKQLGRSA